tara:strand:+ start:279 stop:614 length:336 start_codon:yes stop_codon:yes gene_type:complete
MAFFGLASCQVWANISGDSNPVALRDNYNVSSLTDHDTGDHSVNIDTDMPNANYSAYIGGANDDNGCHSGISSNDMAVGSFRYFTRTGSITSGKTDMPLTLVAAFGDPHYG